jgi:iron uptake system component EfeO
MARHILAKNISVPTEAGLPLHAIRRRNLLKVLWLPSVTLCLLPTISAASFADAASLQERAEQYRPYLVEGISQALSGARALQERAAAKDLQGAKEAWISARAGWERVEVFTGGFAPEFEEKIDAWPNSTHGFHAIEARLFGANRTDVDADASVLVGHLTVLLAKAREIQLASQGLLNGTARLAYEIGDGKSGGGESRISNTSLDDMRNNVAGIQIAYDTVFSSAIESTDSKLAVTVRSAIERLKTLLDVSALNKVDTPKLRQASEELAVLLQNAAPEIGLARPSLESIP